MKKNNPKVDVKKGIEMMKKGWIDAAFGPSEPINKSDDVDEVLDKGVLNHWTRSQIKAALDQAYQQKHAEEIRQLQVKHAAEMSILDQEITSLKAAITRGSGDEKN